MANETQYHVSVNADGVESGLTRAQKSWDAYQATVSAAADRQVQKQKAIDEAVANSADTSSKAQRSIKSFMDSLAREADAAGKTRAQLMELKAAQMGVSDSAQVYINRLKEVEAASGGAHSGTAGVNRELMVLAHELSQGNFSRFGGSLMVLGEQLNVMKYVFNPVVAGFAAMSGIGYVVYEAMHHAAEGQKEIANAMAITGNYAGLTQGVLLTYAETISRNVSVSSSDAADAIMGLAKSGKVSADQLQAVSESVVAYAKASGEKTEEVAKEFESAYGRAGEAARKWQEVHHDLTDEQIRAIEIIERSGDKAKAWSTFVIDASAAARKQVVDDNRSMADSYETLGEKWSRFWRGIVGGGDQLQKLHDNLKELQSIQGTEQDVAPAATQAAIADTKKQIAALLDQKKGVDENAAALAAANRIKEEANRLDEQAWGNQQKLTKALKDNKAAHDAAIVGLSKELSPAARAASISAQDALLASQNAAAHREFDPRKTSHASYKEPKGDSLLEQAREAGAALDAQLTASEKLTTWEEKRVGLAQTLADYVGKTLTKQQASVVAKQKELLAQYEHNAAVEKEVKQKEALEKLHLREEALEDKLSNATQAMAEQQQIELQTATLTTQEKQRQLALLQIETNRRKELAEWEKQAKKDGTYGTADYSKGVDSINGNAAKQAANTNGFFNAKDAANADWVTGAKNALNQYQADAQNVASQVQSAFQSAFTGMEDAFVKFCQTGKLDFGDLAKSIVADIERMAAKAAVSGLFSWATSAVSSYFGSGGSSGATFGPDTFHLAEGGHVQGPGSGTSDSIPAWLSNGEYVLTADAVRRIGVDNLDKLNNGAHVGSAARYASGGLVSSSVAGVSGGNAGSGSNVAVTVNSGGGLDQSDAPMLEKAIKAVVDSRIAQKMKGQGGFAWQLKNGSV